MLFSISFCFYRACFTHLNSSNLSCNLCLWYYNQLVHFDKEINANVYHHILSGRILSVSTVHLNGIWNLIWRYLSKPVLGGHPVLSGHHSIPRGCPLNTGFTVSKNDDLQGHYNLCLYLLAQLALWIIIFEDLSILYELKKNLAN